MRKRKRYSPSEKARATGEIMVNEFTAGFAEAYEVTDSLLDAAAEAYEWEAEDDNLYATKQAYDICERLVPEWRDLFISKNRKYRRVNNDLGPRGVFPDVNRKHFVLKDRVWDGGDVVGEPTREVVMDQIGHLFLLLHMLDEEQGDV